MNTLRLYLRYIKMNFLAGLQYKGWSLMVLQVFMVVVTDPISVIFLFSRFGDVGIWSATKIMLIYAMAITSFGLAETLCRGLDYFPWKMIRTGDFDRLLLRPQPLLVQAAGSYFHIHRIARVVSGIVVIVWCLRDLKVEMSLLNIVTIIMALVGGFLTYTGVFIFTSGIAFFTIQGLDWIYIFTNASYQVTRCPVDYLPNILRNVFTFFVPILVMSYYPAAAVCNWGQPYWKGLLALPAGLLFMTLSTLVWRFGVNHYQSTGS